MNTSQIAMFDDPNLDITPHDIFDVGPPQWLDPHTIDYHGQNSPPQWHAALTAIIRLRPKPGQPNTLYHTGYLAALLDIHQIIARALGQPQ